MQIGCSLSFPKDFFCLGFMRLRGAAPPFFAERNLLIKVKRQNEEKVR
jgi:hypothetical protein